MMCSLRLLVLMLAAWVFIGAGPAQAQDGNGVCRVDIDVSASSPDGATWSTAYSDLKATFRRVGCDEIWIAEGTYTPTTGTDRTADFLLTGNEDGRTIYGGFDGTETSRGERDPAAHTTTLSGDIGAQGDASDNSYHVLYLDGRSGSGGPITAATVIDGVTVRGGNASVGASIAGFGGGLLCEGRNSGGGCSPTLSNVTFRNNTAVELGGAMYNIGISGGESSPVLTDVTFLNNSADKLGGAVYNDGTGGTSSPEITNSTFQGNTAASGGALYNGGRNGRSNPTITGTTFLGNTALFDGADGNGAAIFNDGSGSTGTSSPTIAGCTFASNTAGRDGGALFNDGREGGTSEPSVVNSVLAHNRADFNGGAIYSIGGGGGGISSPAVLNVTLTGNSAGADGGAFFNDVTNGGTAEPTITNSILYGDAAGNGGPEIYNRGDGSTPTITYSLLDGGCGGIRDDNNPSGSNCDDGNTGTVMTEAPQFAGGATLAGDDGTLGTADDSLQAVDGSPVLDAGSNAALDTTGNGSRDVTTDITGGSRVTENNADATATVDLGAYEAPASVLPVELAGFEAQLSGEAVTLTWQTASETGNAGFRVQRHIMGGVKASRRDAATRMDDWQTVGAVEGAGTTTRARSYRFEDTDLPYVADSLTYRLKQVDTDGSASYSDPVTVARSGVDALQLRAPYPNPARSRVTVRFAIPDRAAGEVTLHLYDVLGRQVRAVRAEATSGRHELQLDTGGLAGGVYFLRLSAGGATRTQKLTVVK